MSLSSVLASLRFWKPGTYTWTDATSVGFAQYAASSISEDNDNLIRLYIQDLYSRSPSAAAALDKLAASGPIRIAGASTTQSPGPAFFVPGYGLQNGGASDPYVLIDPDSVVYALNDTGNAFLMSLELVLIHEIGHWALSTKDPLTADPGGRNVVMNAADYDYEGSSERFEWQSVRSEQPL